MPPWFTEHHVSITIRVYSFVESESFRTNIYATLLTVIVHYIYHGSRKMWHRRNLSRSRVSSVHYDSMCRPVFALDPRARRQREGCARTYFIKLFKNSRYRSREEFRGGPSGRQQMSLQRRKILEGRVVQKRWKGAAYRGYLSPSRTITGFLIFLKGLRGKAHLDRASYKLSPCFLRERNALERALNGPPVNSENSFDYAEEQINAEMFN